MKEINNKMKYDKINDFIKKYTDGEAIAMALIFYINLKSVN